MSFAIVLSDVRGHGNRGSKPLVGWKATVYPVDGYDKCECHGGSSKPVLGCQYVESDIHRQPKDAIAQVADIAARQAISAQGAKTDDKSKQT